MIVHKGVEDLIKSFCSCLEQKYTTKNIDLTGQQAIVVGFVHKTLSEKGSVIQRDIERFFNQRGSTISKMIDRLEEKRFLRREKADGDLRAKKLVLTKKAEENIEMIKAYVDDIEKKMLNGISKEEIKSFNSILDKMIKNLNEE